MFVFHSSDFAKAFRKGVWPANCLLSITALPRHQGRHLETAVQYHGHQMPRMPWLVASQCRIGTDIGAVLVNSTVAAHPVAERAGHLGLLWAAGVPQLPHRSSVRLCQPGVSIGRRHLQCSSIQYSQATQWVMCLLDSGVPVLSRALLGVKTAAHHKMHGCRVHGAPCMAVSCNSTP